MRDKYVGKVNIKPFSQNKARRGRQWKTQECEQFMEDFAFLLLAEVPQEPLPEGDLEIHFLFGMWHPGADYDNPLKTAQDVVAAHYGIDDKRFIGGSQCKIRVKKEDEFIAYVIRVHSPVAWSNFTGLPLEQEVM